MKKNKSAAEKTRVLLVDEHSMVRHALKQLIDHEANLFVCSEAETAAQALRQIAARKPDLIIMDLVLPDMSGMELIRKIRERRVQAPILVVSMQGGGYDRQIAEAGANGRISKADAAEKIIPAIHEILKGRTLFTKIKTIGGMP